MSRSDAPETETAPEQGDTSAKRELPEAAKRALAEAAARRAERERQARAQQDGEQPKEFGGAKGPDPVRYGDWEKDGIISDF